MNYSISSTIKQQSAALLVLALILTASAAAADFGMADWGMTTDQVKALETRPNLTPFSENGYLIYSVTLPGIDQARLVYQFDNDQLTHGRFIFRPNQPLNVVRSIEHYQQIKTLISSQYGPPNTDDMVSRDEQVPATLSPIDMANELSADRLILKSSWRTENATLFHQLAWNVDRPHHQLHYVPLNAPMTQGQTDAF